MDLTNEQIKSEVERIKYLYKMKGVARFDTTRDKHDRRESVAEHLYGMQLLAHYFLKLEDPEGQWDRERIMQLILVHDMNEIETGDIVGYRKTVKDRQAEREATETMLNQAPDLLRDEFRSLLAEYETQDTIEARFAKAIDKTEATFEIYDETGKKIVQGMKTTLAEHNRIRLPYFDDFPYIIRFNTVLTESMIEQGYFYEEKNQ